MEFVFYVLLVCLITPPVAFVTVKLCTYAYYRGRQIWLDEQHKKEMKKNATDK